MPRIFSRGSLGFSQASWLVVAPPLGVLMLFFRLILLEVAPSVGRVVGQFWHRVFITETRSDHTNVVEESALTLSPVLLQIRPSSMIPMVIHATATCRRHP